MESRHGGTASFVQSVPVHEEDGGHTIWDGNVHVFSLSGHPDGAFRVYAWSFEQEDGNRRFCSVLHSPLVYNPALAIRAAIVAKFAGTSPGETLTCPHCGQTGMRAEDKDGAELPQGFHLEIRPGLAQVVVCDRCDEIIGPGI